MDSVTHLVLGAAVGELMLGKKLGNKAMLLGAVANTIPDLDVFYHFINPDPVNYLVVHRSYTHSLLGMFVLPLLIALFSHRWSKKPVSYTQWYWFWFAGMCTHIAIDCCTTFGTKVFTPFSDYQVAFNNLSIIDPVYTLPFLVLVLIALFISRTKPLRRKFVLAGVGVSSLYLLITFFVKWDVQNKFRESLKEHKIGYDELNTTPTILNGILWSANAFNDSMIYIGEYSYFNKTIPIEWVAYHRNLNDIKAFDCDAIHKMQWFAEGNYFVQQPASDTLIFYNAKWGRMRYDATAAHDAFVFYTLFYKQNGTVKYEQVEKDWKFNESLKLLMNRVGI